MQIEHSVTSIICSNAVVILNSINLAYKNDIIHEQMTEKQQKALLLHRACVARYVGHIHVNWCQKFHTGLKVCKVTQGHWNCQYSMDHMSLSINGL